MKTKRRSSLSPEQDSPQTAWGRFWFQYTDPTTLGFMRIMAGIVVLYVHFAYCYDFKAFFGPESFIDTDTVNRDRKEHPILIEPWNRWETSSLNILLPTLADRRMAVYAFLDALPESKKNRDEKLAYLYYLFDNYGYTDSPVSQTYLVQGIWLIKEAAKLSPAKRKEIENSLGSEQGFKAPKSDIKDKDNPDNGIKSQHGITIPPFFLLHTISLEQRVKLWNQALVLADFVWSIPDYHEKLNREHEEHRLEQNIAFLLAWLMENTPSLRKKLIMFFQTLPDGPKKKEVIDFLTYWRSDPQQAFDRGQYTFSLFYHINNMKILWAIHISILVIMLLFTLGLWTRVTSLLTWLGALQYIQRSNHVLFGMDTMMNILLFYLMIGPSGAALSLDRLLARYRAARIDTRTADKSKVAWARMVLAGPVPSRLANFTIRLVQIHFMIIYLSSGLSKLKGTMWWNTTATWFTLANPEFTPLNHPIYEKILRLCAGYKPLMWIIYAVVDYFTLFLEISLPFLVWSRARPVIVIAAIFLHAGIAMVMGLTVFGLLMLTLLLSYVSATTIRQHFFSPPPNLSQLRMRVDPGDRKQTRLAAFLKVFDIYNQISLDTTSPNSRNGEGPELLEKDTVHRGQEILKYAWEHLHFGFYLKMLFWVPGVGPLVKNLCGLTNASI